MKKLILAAIAESLRKNMLSSMRLCANVPAQHAIAPALAMPAEDPDILPGGRIYERRELITNALREILSFLLKIAFGFFVVIAIFVGIIIGITFLTALIALVSALFFLPMGSTLPFSLEAMGLAAAYEQAPATLILFTVALFVLLLVPLYAIIHMVLSLSKKVQPMSTGQRIAWVVIWIIALCCIVPAGITVSYYHDEQRKEEYNQKHIYQRDFTDTWEQKLLQHGEI